MDYFGSQSPNLYFIFSAPSLYPKIFPLPLRGIYRRYKQINIHHFSNKNWNIAGNIICFIRNVVIFIARQSFSAYPIYLSISIAR